MDIITKNIIFNGLKSRKKKDMKTFLLIIVCLASWGVAEAQVEGTVYLKEGRNVTFKGRDRLKIPRRKQDVKGWRNAYGQDKRKEKFAVEEVDSVVCWNSRCPERQRRFIPADGIGWCWVYFETPHILTLVFAKKGYGIAVDGGIRVWQRHGIFHRSHVGYYLRKRGEAGFWYAGKAKAKTGNKFLERLCGYVREDAELCRRIREADTWRDKTIALLMEYCPED